MGTRIKSFEATGLAPNGRLYAGDLNAMQDDYADLNNLTQTLGVGTIQVGESGLQIIRFGAGEMRISGALRTDKTVRALGGFIAGTFTTAQRNALLQADRQYGTIILNTDLNLYEWNRGTDVSPNWQPMGQALSGTFANMPAAGFAGRQYWDTTNRVMWVDHGTVWEPLDGAYPGMEMDYSGPVSSLSGLVEVFPHWLLENGVTLPVGTQYDRLRTAVGVGFGSNGTLPNARGRVAVYRDDVNFVRGQAAGEINHTLTEAELASHAHGGISYSNGNSPVTGGSGSGGSGITNSNGSTLPAGGNQPHNNMQPYFVTGGRLIRY